MNPNFEILRQAVLKAQEGDPWKMFSDRKTVLEQEAFLRMKDLSELPVARAEATVGLLDSIQFDWCPGEPLIGRIHPLPAEPVEKLRDAAAWLEEHHLTRGPGQTGHCEPDYERIFEVGIDGILDQCEASSQAGSPEKKQTYQTFQMVLRAFSRMIGQAAETIGKRDSILSESCRWIAHRPPRNFRDAIQLMWFIDAGIQYGDNAWLVGPGRIDERLGRFYERDIAEGTLTREEALDMIVHLYLFINSLCKRGLAYGLMVGGDTVNPVSYLALEALRKTRLVYPGVGICANERTPHDLLRLAVDIVSEGIPNPAFFNDVVIREGLIRYGVPEAESGEYINSTCVEITPCGASNVYVASPYYNLCGTLLRVMNSEYDSFEALFDAFKKDFSKQISEAAESLNQARKIRAQIMRRPLQSVFTKDCLGHGLDIESGGARYNWVECSFVGMANFIDSMIVIREEVFRLKDITLCGLKKILDTDFENNESLRQKFLNRYPKYGMDCRDTDALIRSLVDFVVAECGRHKIEPHDSAYIPGMFCWVMHQRLGAETGATPDGRRAGFPFADGAGPAQGREKFGPTAAVRSVCSWSPSALIGGCAFNMKFTRAILSTDEAREKLLSLLKTFLGGGGFQTQINVVDNDMLKKAALHPEHYSDLVVRIGGYTDYFVHLSKEMQSELILRTQYSEL